MDDQQRDLTLELIEQTKRHNELLERHITLLSGWKVPLRNGLITGVATVVGATVLVSLLVWTLKPFERFVPAIEQISEQLENPPRRR